MDDTLTHKIYYIDIFPHTTLMNFFTIVSDLHPDFLRTINFNYYQTVRDPRYGNADKRVYFKSNKNTFCSEWYDHNTLLRLGDIPLSEIKEFKNNKYNYIFDHIYGIEISWHYARILF